MPTLAVVRELEGDAAVRKHGDLPDGARRVLDVLLERPGLDLDLPQIAERASLDLAETDRSLERLVRDGFVEVLTGPTGRKRYLVG